MEQNEQPIVTESRSMDVFGHELSASLLEAVPDGLLIVGASDGRIRFLNGQAALLLGYERTELLGQPVESLLPENLHDLHRRHRQRYESDLRPRAMGPGRRLRARRRDGSEFPVEISLSPLRLDDATFVVAAMRDVSDRVAAEQELRSSQDALQSAQQAVAISDERDRIARDLHDTVIQRLFGAGLNLQSTMAVADDAVRDRLSTTIDDLDDTIRELRSAIFDLQSNSSGAASLRALLLEVISSAGAAMATEPSVKLDGSFSAVPPEVAEELLPTVREAVTNASRHANASRVQVHVAVGDELVLEVTDDGIGVPGAAGAAAEGDEDALEVSAAGRGNGLRNMRIRAERLGGRFTLGAGADGGTRVTWSVPLSSVGGEGSGTP